MEGIKLLIRRIRRSEQECVGEFCSSDYVEDLPFKKHSNWISRATKELEGDDARVVFGAFLPEFSRGGMVKNYSIVGCLFIKPSLYDETVELKNLVTANENFLHQDNFFIAAKPNEAKYIIKKKLVEKAIRYCEVREFPKVEMELLQDMKQEITLLLEMGFIVKSLREKYEPGNYVCILEKQIGETYQADPFNNIKIARWLIHSILPSKITKEVIGETHNGLGARISSIYFEQHPVSTPFNINTPEFEPYKLHGEMLLIKADEQQNFDAENISGCFSQQSHLRYILSDNLTKGSIKQCLDRNIHTFTFQTVKKLAGLRLSSLRIPFKTEDVDGVITVLEKEKIIELSKQNQFKYYLISGIGKALTTSADTGRLLVIYCPHWKDNHSGGIIGYAEVEAMASANFEHAHKLFPGVYPALDEEDLKFYGTYSTKERVRVLKCDRIKFFNEMVILEKSAPHRETSEYIQEEILDNLASSVYLDYVTCDYYRVMQGSHFPFEIEQLPQDELSSINAFIMYSRDSEEHIQWVESLALILNQRIGGVILDNLNLGPGDSLHDFMKNGITKAKAIIIICTEPFKEKIHKNGRVGVNVEWATLMRLQEDNPNPKKIIPILKNCKTTPEEIANILAIKHSDEDSDDELIEKIIKAMPTY